jgi:nucleotide-binding universal stress UspA family protein
MFTQVLVPLDGSRQAERALVLAASIARRTGGAVTLMQVVAADAARGNDAVPVHAGDLPGNHATAAAYLEGLRRRPELAGMHTDIVVSDGNPADRIVTEAEQRAVDLIVLSHRRHGPAVSIFTGSIADEVMRRAPVPVLVLHADATTELGGGVPDFSRWPVRALVPLDGSPLAEAAIMPALDLLSALANGRGGRLHLTYVLDPKRAYRIGTPETPDMHEARVYLASVADRITVDARQRAIEVTWTVQPDANVARGIERVAEDGAYVLSDYFDFVAMGTHGRVGAARWLEGSVTETLVHDVHVPVLIVHQAESLPANDGKSEEAGLEA